MIATGSYIVLTPVLAFLSGLLSYSFMLQLLWDETIGAELGTVVFWGSAVFSVMVPVYFVAVYMIERRFNSNKLLLFTAACLLISFLPVFLIFVPFGSQALFSEQSALATSFFATTGIFFCLCSWIFRRFKPNNYTA
ncbi:hypothetical protein PGH26_13085 [Sporosarcina jeotgali]|uniref:Permease n=1 Tax=Sporosarcina jeotgali TaxID=3020056 RepID=A0ABZ0KTN6_9BACL|nr:hypothetical protein [Sporosarcina sp. B2O-1]WOV83799.1 hypothetical protein PGH26_13085 [Sporosarcina sp. B2O-1]